MMARTFEAALEREITRLNQTRDKLTREISGAKQLLEAINTELEALKAFVEIRRKENSGTVGNTGAADTTREAPGIRRRVYERIARSPEGLTAGDVIQALGTGLKSEETAIRNALAALKRDGRLTRDGRRYKAKRDPDLRSRNAA